MSEIEKECKKRKKERKIQNKRLIINQSDYVFIIAKWKNVTVVTSGTAYNEWMKMLETILCHGIWCNANVLHVRHWYILSIHLYFSIRFSPMCVDCKSCNPINSPLFHRIVSLWHLLRSIFPLLASVCFVSVQCIELHCLLAAQKWSTSIHWFWAEKRTCTQTTCIMAL